MRKKRALLTFLSFLFMTLVGFGHVKVIQADNYQTNYQVLKAGTDQTSYADAYFSKPAVVGVNEDSYRVSMTVSTDHSLGRFPVQILNVNGQTPQITKSTSGNKDNYVFTFNTKSVKQVMSGNMKVDIDNINYHHKYGFNLKMDAGNVPALKQQSQSDQAKQKKNQDKQTASSSAGKLQASSAKTRSTSSSPSSSSSSVSSSSSSSSSSEQKAKSQKKTSHKKASSNKNSRKDEKQTPQEENHDSTSADWWLGSLVVVIVIVGVVYFIKR